VEAIGAGFHVLWQTKANALGFHLVVLTGGPDNCLPRALPEFLKAIHAVIKEIPGLEAAWTGHQLLSLTIEIGFDAKRPGAFTLSDEEKAQIRVEYGEFPHLYIRVGDPNTLSSLFESISDLASSDFDVQEKAFDRMIAIFQSAEDERGVRTLSLYKDRVHQP